MTIMKIVTKNPAVVARTQALRTAVDLVALSKVLHGVKNSGDGELTQAVSNAIHQHLKGTSKMKAPAKAATEHLLKVAGAIKAGGSVEEYADIDSKMLDTLESGVKAYEWLMKNTKMSFNKSALIKPSVSGSRVKVLYNIKGVNSYTTLLELTSMPLKAFPEILELYLTEDDAANSGRELWSRVFFSTPEAVYQYKGKESSNLTGVVNGTKLWSMTQEMSFSQAMIAAKLSGKLDRKTLEANSRAFACVAVLEHKTRDKVEDGFKIPGKVYRKVELKPITEANSAIAAEGFFGVTGAENYGKKGIANAFAATPIWAELKNGKLMSTEPGNKLVARVDKLCKALVLNTKGEKSTTSATFGRTLIITQWVKASVRSKSVLSTGNYWCSQEDMLDKGLVRLTSSADLGGVKATNVPVGLVSQQLHAADTGLISFGSIKAGWNVLEGLRDSEQTYTFDLCEEAVEAKGILVEGLQVEITNWYSIQMYKPADQDKFNATQAELLGEALDKVLVKASLIEADPKFVDYILKTQEDSGLDLSTTLKLLEGEGEIVRKAPTTQVTPTEFDIMALSHGHQVAFDWMDELLQSPLNRKKSDKFKEALNCVEWTKPSEDSVMTIQASELIRLFVESCEPIVDAQGSVVAPGCSINSLLGGAPNRNALVMFMTKLGFVKNEEYSPHVDYIRVVHEGESVLIPTSSTFISSTFKSNPELDCVVASGLLDKMRKYFRTGAEYMANKLNAGKAIPAGILKQFVESLQLLVEAELLGKDLGKLNAKGDSFVLCVAPWAEKLHDVFISNMSRYTNRESCSVIGTKMPLWTLEAHAGFKAQGLDLGVFGDKAEAVAHLLECAVFIHPLNALALQNDSDGDLYRLVFAKTKVPYFKAKVLDKGFAFNHFFNKYVEKELNYADKAGTAKELKEVSFQELYAGCQAAYDGKKNVALYTSYYFKYLRQYNTQALDESTKDAYEFKAHLAGTFIQVYAMNTIKHTSGGLNVVDKLGEQLPEDLTAIQLSKHKAEATEQLYWELTNPAGEYRVSKDLVLDGKDLMQVLEEFYDEFRSVFQSRNIHSVLFLASDRSPADCARVDRDGFAHSVRGLENKRTHQSMAQGQYHMVAELARSLAYGKSEAK